MNDTQRTKIQEMRRQGLGYATIGKATGLSKDSVKAYCRSHGLTGDLSNGACLACGKPLTQTPSRKRRKFCCDECRTRWWNAHPDRVKKKAIYHFVCPACGKEFTAYGNAHRKYCSHACYIAARFSKLIQK